MLHGKGTGNYTKNSQLFLTTKYEDNRKKGLRDAERYSDSELAYYEISGAEGGGRTNEKTYEIKQFPFPVDATIRKKQTIDVRRVRPELGEMSD